MRILNLEIMANPYNWVMVTLILVIAGIAYDVLRRGLAPPVPAD